MAIKICIGIWDTKNVFNVPTDLAKTMLETTEKFTKSIDNYKCFNNGLDLAGIFTFEDLNELPITLDDYDYTHFILLSSGCIILNPELFVQGIKEQIEKNPGMCLSAQILHTGLWDSVDNPEFFTLHEQTLLFSKHAIDDIKRDKFKFSQTTNFHTENWHKIERDKRNIHDNYTPVDIWPSKDKELITMTKPNTFGMFEDLLQYCIKTNWHIQNFNWEIRDSKIYSYHVQNPEEFLKFMDHDNLRLGMNKDKISVKGHYEFFKKMNLDVSCWWAFNTEEFVETLPDNDYDAFVSVNAGPLPWIYLANYNFQKNTEVTFIDIAPFAENFGVWFIENYEPNKFDKWHNVVDHFILDTNGICRAIGNKILSDKIWDAHKEMVDKNWHKIKNFKYNFVTEDMIKSDTVNKKLKESQYPMVWFSNIFRYFPTWTKNYTEDDFQNFLNKLISNNRNVSWIGSSHSNRMSTGPNSKPYIKAEFCKPFSIKDFDSNIFLNDIEKLEKLNLFTDHRGGGHPGWSSFVLHGLGFDKTLGYENYGYENDIVAPYDWTTEALEHCPNIVEYFKNSNIKKRYHRLRIMRLAPGGYISIHDDDPNNTKRNWALNIAVNNPDKCQMHFWNDEFQYTGMVPWEPSKAFLIRIHWKHMVMNLSDQIRYHIIVHGEDYE